MHFCKAKFLAETPGNANQTLLSQGSPSTHALLALGALTECKGAKWLAQESHLFHGSLEVERAIRALDRTASRVFTDFQISSTSESVSILPKQCYRLGRSTHNRKLGARRWEASHPESKTEICIYFSVASKTRDLLGLPGACAVSRFYALHSISEFHSILIYLPRSKH